MIHKYIFRDKFIVLDVNSGSVHIVDPVIYDIMDYYIDDSFFDRNKAIEALSGKYPIKDLKEAINEIDELVAEGMLFTNDDIPLEIYKQKAPVIKAICLHVAHDCNMNCSYCFGDKGAFEGVRCLLSEETGKKAVDFLIEHSGRRHNLEVDFFGGEPLMNFDVVKQLVKYARSIEKEYDKCFRFTITTNGLLLDDEKADFINEHMDNVILSIDGRPDVNDRMRKTVNGKGTYDLIVPKFKRFADKRDGLYFVRGTFTGYNLDFADDIKHLLELGFKNVSVEPVVTDAEYGYSLKDDDLEAIFREYEKLADMYIENALNGEPFDFFHYMVDLEQGPCIVKRVFGCGAGTEYVAISPEGDIYPCHQFVGNTDFRLGNLYDEKFENRFFEAFNNADIYNKSDCMECWARFYCSGGCHSNAFKMNGDILRPYNLGCEMEKKRLECAIGIQAYLSDNTQEGEI